MFVIKNRTPHVIFPMSGVDHLIATGYVSIGPALKHFLDVL
jgi:hypothetical protein